MKISLNKKLFFNILGGIVFCFLFLGFFVSTARAADLYFSPTVGSYQLNDNFVVNVLVHSRGQAINAVSAEIYFPNDKLESVAFSKNESIFSFWLNEPTYVSQQGKISIDGIILNPGYNGTNGKIISLKFKVKKAGEAKIYFNNASVLANDGKATNVLENIGEAKYNLTINKINLEGANQSTTPATNNDSPVAPKINSSTHPDPDNWYLNKNVRFSWPVLENAIGLRFAYDRYPTSNLTEVKEQAKIIYETTFYGLEDGVWYFHLQFKNNNGWGAISHFRFQIDSQSPNQFSIKNASSEECPDNPQPIFMFKTDDVLSGIDHYKVKIDGSETKLINPEQVNNGYLVDKQAGGNHIILVEAYDRAGNFAIASTEFCIKPLPTPMFVSYPVKLEPDQPALFEGVSVPNAIVKIWLQKSGGDPIETKVNSSQQGNFSFIPDQKLAEGIYKVWAQAIDLRGAMSDVSDKINFAVDTSAPLKVGRVIVDYMSVFVVLIALIILLVFIIYSFTKKISSWKKRVNSDVKDTENTLRDAFGFLKDETEKQVSRLDGQEGLSPREKEISDNLKRSISVSEKMISKEIDDIKKDTE